MVARVQKISEGYGIVMTEDALRDLNLREGSVVEINGITESAAPAEAAGRISTEEALEIYHRTKPRFQKAYEDLAK